MVVNAARALALSLLLAGCMRAGAPATASNEGDTAPLPYTDRQIRETCRPGHTLVYRVDEPGLVGTSLTLRVVGVSMESVEVETMRADQQGEPLGPPRIEHPRWDEFRQHSAFPKHTTSIQSQRITIPAGTFDTSVYTVRREKGVVERYYFAKTLPGPPLVYLTERDGIAMRVSTVVSISDQR